MASTVSTHDAATAVAARSARSKEPAVTKLIGRFELIRELARGGMGQVFLARDTRLGRKVAIKFLLDDDEEMRERFLVEARATASCTHENIVAIHEVGEHEGRPYMVLEYLEGKTLTEHIRSTLGVHQLVELLIPVVRALERAHEHGIVHRDLKPSNIFVTDRGQVKVLDFGIARVLEGRSAPLTSAHSFVGTVPYMSPEQWGIDVVDHRSDLWAIGILCWRALANDHPVGSFEADVLLDELGQLSKPVRSIVTQVPTIVPELAAIIDRCLEKQKTRRYQSASELLRDLQAFLAPAPVRVSAEVSPYQGLATFGETSSQFFSGGRTRSAAPWGS